jgi:lysophospholipase L1-like esterase
MRRGLAALVTSALLGAGMIVPAMTAAHASPPTTGPWPACSVPCISIGDTTMVEGDTGSRTISLPVTLSQPSSTQITVQYRIASASATGGKKAAPGIDFNDKSGTEHTLTFKVGSNGLTKVAASVSVPVFADTAAEGDETFRVILSNPTGGARLSRALGIGTILDDDASPDVRVAIGDSSVVEGSSGTGRKLMFPVTLSSPLTSALTLQYAIAGVDAQWSKTATGGGDFGGKTAGTIVIKPGRNGTTPVVKKLAVTVWPDALLENDETLTVAISAASLPPGVSITRATGTGTIIDDDATPTSTPAPSSMAALGDSMTKAFDACDVLQECPAVSWSTGTQVDIDSQYSRLLLVNPAMNGHAHNDAVSGAQMNALNGQAASAVGQGVDYVTIEMGANDACTSTESAMTSVATFQSQFQSAMNTLKNGLPNAHVLVASIPDLERLWQVGHVDADAVSRWTQFAICQAMLVNPTSMAQADIDRRARVRQRVVDFDTALATVCAQWANCRFDDNTVFSFPFELPDISSIDYFHPSQQGQTMLALGTYAAGWNW